MTDPGQYMAVKCRAFGQSMYSCKVAGQCDCGKDDDLYAAYERQCMWRAKRLAAPMLRDAIMPAVKRYATEVQVVLE